MKLQRGAARKGIAPAGAIVLQDGPLTHFIRALAVQRGAASAESCAEQIIEWFRVDQRSKQRYVAPAEHYTATREWAVVD